MCLALAAAACGSDSGSGTVPSTPVTIPDEIFSSVLAPRGTSSRSFTSRVAGTISVTLTDAGATIGVGVGLPRVTGGGCRLGVAVSANGGSTPQISVPADEGRYLRPGLRSRDAHRTGRIHLESRTSLTVMSIAYDAFLAEWPEVRLHGRDRPACARRTTAASTHERHVYLDYTGGSLYGVSQVRDHQALLQRGVFGNPHSAQPSVRLATTDARRADAARRPRVLQRPADRLHGDVHRQRHRCAQAGRRGLSVRAGRPAAC